MSPTVLAGPEEIETSVRDKLCSTCESLLIRPQNDWDTGKISQIGYSKRLYDDVISSANNGCPICKNLQNSIIISPNVQSDLMHRGMSCTLHWNKEAGKFDSIHISQPLVHFKLFLEEDVSFIFQGKKNELLNTSSDMCLNLVTDWIINCTKYHPQCNQAAKEARWLPTRLIDIGSPEGTCSPRLIDTAKAQLSERRTDYVALTHRWKSGETFELTSKNIHELQRKIPLERLPLTFQDAIRFTKRLGIEYLWIDSLCIQQDCKIDWQKESAAMRNVYGRSYCNIAAAAAAAGHEGLFVDRNTLSHASFKIHLNWKGHQRTYYCLYNDLWYTGVTKTPLNRRGWIVQERLLSPRTLSFNTQLFWECRQLKACESFPQGLGADADFSSDDIDEDSELCSKAWATESTKSGVQYAPWTKVVEQFMVCDITKATDKLIAVSGIARKMQSLLGDNYVAGLWERNLTFDLLWYVEKGRQGGWRDSFRVESYRAPSWSWASVEGRVHFACGQRDYSWGPPLIKILAVEVEPATDDTAGQLKGGYILTSGLLLRLPAMRTVPDYALELMPGAGTAYCFDDWQDLVLEDLYFFPVRSMKSANGVELLGLILTPKSDGLRRVGLLSIRRDEMDEFDLNDGFEWEHEHCIGWLPDQNCGELSIKIV